MKLIFKIILLSLLFNKAYSQNLIQDGGFNTLQLNDNCGLGVQHIDFKSIVQPDLICGEGTPSDCVTPRIFSTNLINETCNGGNCQPFSFLTGSGVQGIPSSYSGYNQTTPNFLNNSFEVFLALPLIPNYGTIPIELEICRTSGIFKKFDSPLKSGIYKIEFDAVYKVGGDITEGTPRLHIQFDDNESLNDPEYEEMVLITENGGSNNSNWQHVEKTVYIDGCNNDYFKIIRKEGKRGGLIFIDNIKLTSMCPIENRCSLNKFNEDNNITSNNIHNALTPLTFTGLAGLPLATLLIYKGNNIVASKTFVQPLNTIYWDGKNNDGNELDNDEYSYKLMAFTRCDCGITLENDFHKTGNMNIPFPVLNNAVQSASQAIIISNLNNVHEMSFKIISTNDAVVYTSPTYFNPPNQFYWNGSISGNGFLASENYLIKIFAKNNCGEKENSFPIQVISPIDYNNFPPNTFLNSSITKDDFMCSKTNYFPAYFAPLPCCSSAVNLSYSNGFIEGNQDFISYGNITLGENLTILPGSTIDFIANDNVILNPGVIIDGTSSYVVLENQNCTAQRIGMAEDSNDSISNSKDERNKIQIENNLVNNITIFPNPANNNFTINASEQIISYVVYDVSGKQITRQENVAEKSIQVSSENLNTGIYFVNVITPKNNQTTKLMVSKE